MFGIVQVKPTDRLSCVSRDGKLSVGLHAVRSSRIQSWRMISGEWQQLGNCLACPSMNFVSRTFPERKASGLALPVANIDQYLEDKQFEHERELGWTITTTFQCITTIGEHISLGCRRES